MKSIFKLIITFVIVALTTKYILPLINYFNLDIDLILKWIYYIICVLAILFIIAGIMKIIERTANASLYDPLKYSYVGIFGWCKTGKTGLATKFGGAILKNKKRLKKCHAEIDELNKGGYNLTKPEVTLFADYLIKFDKKQNYFANIFRFGMPDNEFDKQREDYEPFEVDYIPPYSTEIYDESRRGIDSYDGKAISDRISNKIMLHGHNSLNAFWIYQRINDMPARLKDICELFILLRKRQRTFFFPLFYFSFKRKKFVFKKLNFLTVWQTILYNEPADLQAKKKPRNAFQNAFNFFFGRDLTINLCEYKNFYFWGNIENHYDYKYYKPAFYSGIKDFKLEKAPEHNNTKASFENFNKKISVFKPKGFTKTKPINKKPKKEKETNNEWNWNIINNKYYFNNCYG